MAVQREFGFIDRRDTAKVRVIEARLDDLEVEARKARGDLVRIGQERKFLVDALHAEYA